jgi:hypothetical protein
MLARWERIYRVFFFAVLIAVAALVIWKALPVLWDALAHGGWRPRTAFGLCIGWYVTVRLLAKTSRFRAFVSLCLNSGLLHVVGFNFLFVVFPLGVCLYLAPLRNPGEMLFSTALIMVLMSVVEWKGRRSGSQ